MIIYVLQYDIHIKTFKILQDGALPFLSTYAFNTNTSQAAVPNFPNFNGVIEIFYAEPLPQANFSEKKEERMK